MKAMKLIGGMTGVGAIGDAWVGGWFRNENDAPRYRVQSGDTVNTLASKYLNGSGRARELWSMQSFTNDARHGGDINRLRVGDEMVFPADGVNKAIALGLLEEGPGNYDNGGSTSDWQPPPQDANGVYQLPETEIVAYAGEADDWPAQAAMPAPLTTIPISPSGASSPPVTDLGEADQWPESKALQGSMSSGQKVAAVVGAVAALGALGVYYEKYEAGRPANISRTRWVKLNANQRTSARIAAYVAR